MVLMKTCQKLWIMLVWINIVNCQIREKLIHRYICVIILLIDLYIKYLPGHY